MSNQVSSVGNQAAKTVGQAKDLIGDVVSDAGENVRHEMGRIVGQVQDGYQQSREIVRTHPTQSVAIALGIGLMVGTVFGVTLRNR